MRLRPSTLLAPWLCLASCLAVLAPGAARADDGDDLVALVNAFRAAPPERCDGQRLAAAGPLAPSRVLAEADETAAEGDLGKALRTAGYRAANATGIVVAGAGSAAEVAQIVELRFCSSALDPRYTEVGVVRRGNVWRLNLARPLLPRDLAASPQAGRAILQLVNDARQQPRRCGGRGMAAVPPLAWSDPLTAASVEHSAEMARYGYFSHTDRGGGGVAERVLRQGYAWRVVGENIAAGLGAPSQVVAGWLASPGHCANIMSPDFTEMGAGYVADSQSELGIYWTQAFGRR